MENFKKSVKQLANLLILDYVVTMAEAEIGQSAPTNKDLFQCLYGLVSDFSSKWRKVES